MIRAATTLTVIAFTLSAPTLAMAGAPVVQAVQVGQEAIRYDKGVPTLDLAQSRGAVQIVPLGKDHGSYVFGVAVFNSSNVAANFDVSNVSVVMGSQQVSLFSVDQLVSKAKSRATWSQIGLAVVGGLGSAASASQRNVYRSTFRTPRATYRLTFTAPSLAGQLRAQRIQDDTVGAMGMIQARLDETRERLGDEIVQLTTVEPGGSYAGKIVLEKLKFSSLPGRISLVVSWNGEQYPFSFQVAKSGTPAPAFTLYAKSQTVARPAEPQPAPALLRDEDVNDQAVQQVAYQERRARSGQQDGAGLATVRSYTQVQTSYRGLPAGPSEPPKFLNGGLVEVPYQAASWASTIDPWTRGVVPINPPAQGPQVIVGG
jgi:hypothetical protein